MCCGSVSCGATCQIMQSATQCTAVVHTMQVIRVYDEAGNVIETHEHAGDLLSLQAQAEKRKCREDFHLPALILYPPVPNDLVTGGVDGVRRDRLVRRSGRGGVEP